MPKTNKSGRPDRRYKNAEDAPEVVSEKRMTFFLSNDSFRELRRQTGYFQIHNAKHDTVDDTLPESPSALVREAIEFWLDHFRLKRDCSRTDDEWEDRLDALSDALQFLGISSPTPTTRAMLLHTTQGENFDITTDRVDHTLSSYNATVANQAEVHGQLAEIVGTDMFIWYSLDTMHPEWKKVLCDLDAPPAGVLAWVDSCVWETHLLGTGAVSPATIQDHLRATAADPWSSILVPFDEVGERNTDDVCVLVPSPIDPEWVKRHPGDRKSWRNSKPAGLVSERFDA